MPDLVELGITTNKKHVTCDAVCKHLFTSDSVVAESQKDPTNISLDLSISNYAQRIKQIHNAFFN